MAIILRTQSACMATHNIPYKAAARSHNSVLAEPTSRTPGHPVQTMTCPPYQLLLLRLHQKPPKPKCIAFFPFHKRWPSRPEALSSRVIYCLFLSTFRCCCGFFFSIFASRSSPSPSIVVNHHPFSGKKKKQTFLRHAPPDSPKHTPRLS